MSNHGDTPPNWEGKSLNEIVQHILARFHAAHREQFQRMISFARQLEKEGAPASCANFLENWVYDIHDHLAKEEDILFPMILDDMGAEAAPPIAMMEQEHHEHDENLKRLHQLVYGLEDEFSSNSIWQKLEAEFANFQTDLQTHVHLENNVLFPRALSGEPAGKAEPRH